MPPIPIQDRFNFEPDGNALAKWLSTRKTKRQINNTAIPGLYSDFKFSDDARWFWIGIVGELIGLGLIFFGASKKGGIIAIIAVVLAVAFIRLVA